MNFSVKVTSNLFEKWHFLVLIYPTIAIKINNLYNDI
jgi:hypothetical protein